MAYPRHEYDHANRLRNALDLLTMAAHASYQRDPDATIALLDHTARSLQATREPPADPRADEHPVANRFPGRDDPYRL